MPGLTGGGDDVVEVLRLHIEAFRRTTEQDGKGIARLALLLLKRRDGRFLGGKLRALLREVEVGRHAVRHLRLGDGEDALRGGDIVLGDGDALAERQDVEIGVGDVGSDGQRHRLLRIARRQLGLFGGAELILVQAPQIDFVARLGRDAESVRRAAQRTVHAALVIAVARGAGAAGDRGKQRRAGDAGVRLAWSTRAAAARRSRFSCWAACSRAGSSGAFRLFHQSVAGHRGACWSCGAVKAGGTSVGRSSPTGGGVEQAATASAATAMDVERSRIFMDSLLIWWAERPAKRAGVR